MKCFLRGSLLGLLTLGAAPLFAQPLEFRTAPEPAAVPSGVSLGIPKSRTIPAASPPSSLLDFQPASSTGWMIVRGKIQDQTTPDSGLRIEPMRNLSGKNGELLDSSSPASVPTFVAPPPTMMAPGTRGNVLSSPAVGYPMPGPIVGHPVPEHAVPGHPMPGPVVGQPVHGPIVGGPHVMDSSNLPFGGHFAGMCGDSCGFGDCGGCGACGACDSCGSWCGCDIPLLSSLFQCPDECGCCMFRPRGWFRAEYLFQAISQPEIPPLLITNGPPANRAFNIGNSGVLFGEDQLATDSTSGGRFSLGFWFPCNSCWGMDASAFWLGKQSGSFSHSNPSTSGIATGRPYINALNNTAQAQLVGFPGELSGRFDVDYYTRLWGFDVNLRHKWLCGPRYYLDWMVGYRHFYLEDSFNMTERLVPVVEPGAVLTLSDSFSTENKFNGGQIGLDGEVRLFRRMFLAGNFKFAMGNMSQSVAISGVSTQTGGQFPGIFPGGLYTSPTNIGTHSANRFCVIPEVGLKIGVDITQRCRVFAGYNFMYVSSVMRAGEQIDQVVNVTRLPFFNRNPVFPAVGPNRPAVLLKQSDFVAHGLTAGFEYRW